MMFPSYSFELVLAAYVELPELDEKAESYSRNTGARMSYAEVRASAAEGHMFDTAGPFDSTATGVALQSIEIRNDQERVQMLSVDKTTSGFRSKERGASMVEYALLVILIAIVAFVAVRVAGQNVSSAFSTVAGGFN